jgi:hypothetical protein
MRGPVLPSLAAVSSYGPILRFKSIFQILRPVLCYALRRIIQFNFILADCSSRKGSPPPYPSI